MDSKTVVIGSSNTDMIVQTPHLPRPGETLLGGTFCTAAGGKGANQAVAAALAEGRALELAVTFANAAAALSVTKLGAQPSAPDRENMEAFLQEQS